MTTEQQDTRNAYQYLMDSFALVEERGLSLSRAFYLMAHSDRLMIGKTREKIEELESLESSEENDEKIDFIAYFQKDLIGREATYMLISRFLETDLLASIPSPYGREDIDPTSTSYFFDLRAEEDK